MRYIEQDLWSIALLCLCIAVAYFIGLARGKALTLIRYRAELTRGARYMRAVDDFDLWCSHLHPAFRLIARHLYAVGEGQGLNSGTPVDQEPCTVGGLRVQLTRSLQPHLGNSHPCIKSHTNRY